MAYDTVGYFFFFNEMTEGKMAGSEIKDLLSFLVLN